MEHSFKRRRVSRSLAGSAGIHHFRRDEPFSSDEEGIRGAGSSGVSHSPRLFSEHNARSLRNQAAEESHLTSLHPRNLVPTKVDDAVHPPVKTVVASVVQVVVNDGTGSEVTQILVPVSSKVVSLQGFAPITLAKAPPTGSEAPSLAASPRNSQHQQPSPTQGAAPGAETSPKSQPTSAGGYGGSNPLSISVPGSKSQVVLSSPPSTPLPPSPASTTSSTSTGSYFSSSAPSSSAIGTSAPSTSASTAPASSKAQASSATQTPNAPSIPVASISNGTSTTNSLTQSGARTTSAGPSFVNPAFTTFSSNGTLVTSTRSRSTVANSASLTSSGSSSHTSSTLASSTSSTSSSSRASLSSSAASSTQLSSSSPSSSASSTGNAIAGGGGSGGSGSTTSAPTSSASSGAGSSGGNPVNTPAVVGGVVGGLAGLAVILLLLLFLLRWRRGKMQRRNISPPIPQSLPPGVASTAPTTERSSIVPFAAGGFLRRLRPGSGQTAETTETTASERGFQNLGGRKLESVLSSRGDGYSDPAPPSGVAPRGYGGTAAGLGLAAGVASPASRRPGLSPGPSDNETLSGSSFYRDSQGFYGGNDSGAGPSSPPPTSPTSAGGSPPGEGFAVTRPGPARTPVINQPGFSPLRPPPGTGRGTPPPAGRGTPPPGAGRGTPPPRNLTPQLRQQDEVGRSHPSFDGSRGSRFSEAV